MARHYSPKSFFRQMSPALLARYFTAKQRSSEADFSALATAAPKTLFDAWLQIPDEPRSVMDAEFRDIFALSCEKGFRAILDEAEWQLVAMARDQQAHTVFVEKLAGMSNHFERAMVTFLDHEAFWKGATLFYHADTLSHWRKRKNLPHVSAATDEQSLDELARLIRGYFHHTEGRGNNCVVEPLRRGEFDYFFAYPEDYSQQAVEWVKGKFGRRPHNPAFEVIYVYSQKEGTVDLNFRGSNKAAESLQGMFATAILKLSKLPPDPKDTRVYDLNLLRGRDFSFTFDVSSGIRNVTVRKLRLSSLLKKGDRITLEADTTRDPHAIYDLLEKIAKAVPLDLYMVTQVELAAMVTIDATNPQKTMPIRITYPNWCSLKYDEWDLKLRDMLSASGIEPKESAESANPPDVEAMDHP